MSRNNESGRSENSQPRVKPWQNKETLERLYFEEGLSQYEIAERFNIDQSTVSYWFKQFGIETDSQDFHRLENANGKIQLRPAGTDEQSVYVHQLVALLEYDPEWVFSEDTHVHHCMAAPYAVDLPENLEVLDGGEHVRRHAEGTATDHPEVVLQHIFGEFEFSSPNSDDRVPQTRLRRWNERLQVNNDGTPTAQADD